jgi:hypothetical protein
MATPVDDYTPMPSVVIQWDQQIREIKGERCWFAMFQYRGKNAFLRGHGTTILQAVAMSERMIVNFPELTELQRQASDRFQGLPVGKGDVYSKSGYGPGGAPTATPKPGQLIRSPATSAQGSVILRLNSAIDAHDYATVLSFVPNGRTDYFGHRNATSTFIEKDMHGDARNYRWTKSIPDLSRMCQG